jgi:hypothetical protein
VLNNRLNTFSDEFLLLNENQTGFRKKYSTLDNTFVIYGLFELLKLKKKKLLNLSGFHLRGEIRLKKYLIYYLTPM